MNPNFARLTGMLAMAISLITGGVAAGGFPPLQNGGQAAGPVETPLSLEDAKPVLGEWTIVAQATQGPVTMQLTLSVQDNKVVGEIASESMGKNAITSLSKYGTDIVLRYSFDYQGNPVETVVTLTPAGEELKAVFDFAGGAYTMPGTATRKKA